MRKSLQIMFEYDVWSRRYDSEFTLKYQYIAPRRTFNAVAAMTDIKRPGLRILDVGCGTGLLSAEFRQANQNAFIAGIDISLGMIRHCRTKQIMNTIEQGDISEPLPFQDSEFDIAMSTGVFELLHKPASVIEEMSRTVKPGGIIAFTCPHNWWDRPHNTQKFKPSLSAFFNWLDRGRSHREAYLEKAMRNSGITPCGTEQFTGYRKNGGKTPYQLYIGQKLDNS